MEDNMEEDQEPLMINEENEENEENERNERSQRISYDELVSRLGVRRFHAVLVLVCGWANASDAVEVLCVSLVLVSVQCDMGATSTDLGLLTAVIFLGSMIGGYVWGAVGDLSGRKPVMISSFFVNGLFGVLSSLSPNLWTFFLFRFFSGLGVGGSVPVIWSYFAEFQPIRIRGRMLSLLAAFWMVGQMITAALAWILIPMTWIQIDILGLQFTSWRLFIALSTFTCLSSSLLCACFLPESPKFLLEKGERDKAIEILRRIYDKKDGNYRAVLNELLQRLEVPEDKSEVPRRGRGRQWNVRNGLMQILSQTGHLFRRPLRSITLVMLCITFCLSFGAYGLTLWLPELMTRARAGGHQGPVCEYRPGGNSTPELNQSCNGSVDTTVFRDSFIIALSSLPGNLITIAFLDRIGRKPIFIGGAVCSALTAFGVWFVSNQTSVLIMAAVFAAVSVLCWNSLDAFGTELFPTHLRSTSMGLTYVSARIGAILGSLAFGALIDAHCAIPVLAVATVLAIGALASTRIPETANVPLS